MYHVRVRVRVWVCCRICFNEYLGIILEPRSFVCFPFFSCFFFFLFVFVFSVPWIFPVVREWKTVERARANSQHEIWVDFSNECPNKFPSLLIAYRKQPARSQSIHNSVCVCWNMLCYTLLSIIFSVLSGSNRPDKCTGASPKRERAWCATTTASHKNCHDHIRLTSPATGRPFVDVHFCADKNQK